MAGKNLPDLIKLTKGTGKYGAILFEDYRFYLTMDKWNRELLDKYCKSFKVGIVAFLPPPPSPSSTAEVGGGIREGGAPNPSRFDLKDDHSNAKLHLQLNRRIGNFSVNPDASLLRIVK